MKSSENWKSKVRELLQRVYPDLWDEEPEDPNSSVDMFYIHFPHILIRNSRGREHNIYDLYLRLKMRKHDGRFVEVEGNRATYNQAEYESRYSHSHLSSTVVRDSVWGGFCMGAEEIVKDIQELQAAPFEGKEDLFEAVLFQLEIFVQWESLEGGPYKKMENISRRKTPTHIYSHNIDDAYNRFIGKYDKVNFNVQLAPPAIIIDPFDEDFVNKVTPLVPDELKVRRDNVTGEFFVDGSTNIYPDAPLLFFFKGDMVVRKVKNEEDENKSKKYYAHPDILRGVSERLERKLTLHALVKRECNEKEADGCIIAGVMVQSI